MKPLVSVLTPAYNRAAFISEAVESVLNQTYDNIEYIVIDDGSTDDTYSILQEYEDTGRLRLLTHKNRQNRGQSASLNLGLKAATGDYIVILDSDDRLHQHKLQKQVEFLEQNPGIGMVYGQAMAIDEGGKELFPIPPDNHVEPGDPNRLLLDCYMALPGGAMVRKTVFDCVGFFEEEFRASQDHDMVIRLAEAAPFAYVKETAFYYRKHDDAISSHGLERRWRAGFEILNRAAARYPYKRSTLRKRRALLHFRMGQVYWKKGNVGRSAIHILLAGFGDPVRAVNVILGVEKPS
ncbi:glycosyltransferase [Marinobacter sp. S0848L]|uniref:glycosyltransferase family 2 protein n=1 Tax=Marinobacter sp. S0848L TaxID=2926423 RepID=UPI001FF4DD78|nr:glycosyltransferase [Marinobacter sp. S0848L]MCK0105478.1 glycosyltransferase [Marinobacter sp. S0848L]